MTKTLKVILWGEEIGRLAWDERRRLSYFIYNPDFIKKGLNISPLVAPIDGVRALAPVWGEDAKIYQKLPAFVADSLPDAWGNQLFDLWRQQNHLAHADITPLDKLSFIGKRGMGALEFEPELSHERKATKIDIKSLADLATRIYTEREEVRILPDESITMQSLLTVGTSAGGRQPKAIIAINSETGEVRSGQVGTLKGFEHCILKFGIKERSMAELEMTYYEMARKAGIKMTSCWLMDVEGDKHFVTKRFDREGERKLHMQTLAALYPEADSYERLLWVCRKMRLSELDSEEVFRRMVFNILANNTDDHNKNFSFLMDEQGRWSLSPAYDLTFIFNTGVFLPETRHCLMIRGKYDGITLDDVMALAAENGIRKAESVIGEVGKAVLEFRAIAERNGVKEQWIAAVENTLNGNLASWGLSLTKPESSCFEIDGHRIENARIEQQFKGNFHLLASIDGKERKYVIRKKTAEHEEISRKGTTNLPDEYLMELISKFMS
jgi:serine/threonine-protein kinase HipA